jgi:hypothetical protein
MKRQDGISGDSEAAWLWRGAEEVRKGLYLDLERPVESGWISMSGVVGEVAEVVFRVVLSCGRPALRILTLGPSPRSGEGGRS